MNIPAERPRGIARGGSRRSVACLQLADESQHRSLVKARGGYWWTLWTWERRDVENRWLHGGYRGEAERLFGRIGFTIQ